MTTSMHAKTTATMRLLAAGATAMGLVWAGALPASAACPTRLVFSSRLTDLAPATSEPFDGAHAHAVLRLGRDRTRVVLSVRGIESSGAV